MKKLDLPDMKILKYIRILFVLALSIAWSKVATAQEIVVNEYYNTSSQNEEWTELVVVKDNLNLSGWFLGDNNAGTSNWQAKIEFKNVPLWKNLRSGTIIIIDHASNLSNCDDATDVDKSDGFIRVCCRNQTFFSGGSTTTLFLADDGDFVQIVDTSGKMVHGIGHDENPGSSVVGGNCFTTSSKWTNTTAAQSATRPCGNFLYYNFNMSSPTSLKVISGTLSDFSAGIQTTTDNGLIDTTDTPFEGIGNGGNNNIWLQKLRAPIMEAQNKCYSKASNGTITLNWDKATDPFPSDRTIGYIIVRSTTNDFTTPENGKQYQVGDIINGSPTQSDLVVGIIDRSDVTTFSENPGTGTFYYRIFPFRYKNTSPNDHFTRGRTYNSTNFVKVSGGGTVQVTALNDTLCAPGIATLKVIAPVDASFSWFQTASASTPISGADSDSLVVSVSQSRSYWVEVASPSVCVTQRYEVKAVFDTIEFNYASTDSICEGTPVVLNGLDGPEISYRWNLVNPPAGVKTTRFDSASFQISVPYFPAKTWIYFSVRARNADGCQSATKKDSIYTIPFDPRVVSSPANPVDGDKVTFRVESMPPNYFVNDWTITNGILITKNSFSLEATATSDSIKVLANIQILLPTDGKICSVNRMANVFVSRPLKPINNLITNDANERNNTLNFDRREVKNLEIFNRWGKKIFSASTYANDWKPETKEEGTYFYTAEVKEPSSSVFVKYSSWLTIVK